MDGSQEGSEGYPFGEKGKIQFESQWTRQDKHTKAPQPLETYTLYPSKLYNTRLSPGKFGGIGHLRDVGTKFRFFFAAHLFGLGRHAGDEE